MCHKPTFIFTKIFCCESGQYKGFFGWYEYNMLIAIFSFSENLDSLK